MLRFSLSVRGCWRRGILVESLNLMGVEVVLVVGLGVGSEVEVQTWPPRPLGSTPPTTSPHKINGIDDKNSPRTGMNGAAEVRVMLVRGMRCEG